MSPAKQPSFEVRLTDILEIKIGELREASKLTLLLADNLDCMKVSGGRKVINFKCMSVDDANEYLDLLSRLLQQK